MDLNSMIQEFEMRKQRFQAEMQQYHSQQPQVLANWSILTPMQQQQWNEWNSRLMAEQAWLQQAYIQLEQMKQQAQQQQYESNENEENENEENEENGNESNNGSVYYNAPSQEENVPDIIFIIEAHGGAGYYADKIQLPPNVVAAYPYNPHSRCSIVQNNSKMNWDYLQWNHLFSKQGSNRQSWQFFQNQIAEKELTADEAFHTVYILSKQYGKNFIKTGSFPLKGSQKERDFKLSEVINHLLRNYITHDKKYAILINTCDTNELKKNTEKQYIAKHKPGAVYGIENLGDRAFSGTTGGNVSRSASAASGWGRGGSSGSSGSSGMEYRKRTRKSKKSRKSGIKRKKTSKN